ncbi:MAG: hypothetical protein ACHP7N_05240 [Caulobacterales bacterium]
MSGAQAASRLARRLPGFWRDQGGETVAIFYVPSATLQVTGAGNRVADQSAWTVVIAQAITLSGSPNLVINANYAASNVPVPAGVGSGYSTDKVTLEH